MSTSIQQNERNIFNTLESLTEEEFQRFRLNPHDIENKSEIMACAVQNGHIRVIQQLYVLDPMEFLKDDSLIYRAIANGQNKALEVLIQLRFSVQAESKEVRGFCHSIQHVQCPMLHAIQNGNMKAIEILHRANPRLIAREEENPLKEALRNMNVSAVETLVRIGATPLFESPAFNVLRVLREGIVDKIIALFGRNTVGVKIGIIRDRVFELLRNDLVRELAKP